MEVRFSEEYGLPVSEVYPFFRVPARWPDLFPAFAAVHDRGGGWYAVPMRGFPVPLLGRIVDDVAERRVRWEFAGAWRGAGHVEFEATPRGVIVSGHERIHLRALPEWLQDRLFQGRFEAVWEGGWRRLRRLAAERRE